MLFERYKDKYYHDVITNAFVVLEERIRSRSGAGLDVYGQQLVDYALNPRTGKLYVGDIESDIEAFEVILMVDLLLKSVERARTRS